MRPGTVRMQAAILPGGRLHLQDGPIDLVIGADGEREAVRRAYAAAARRFETILEELCAELPLLREEMRLDGRTPTSPVARRMDRAVRPLCRERFVTRMAAVAGSVADEVLAAMCTNATLDRAYVNNGGDIAIHLTRGAQFEIGLIDRPERPSMFGAARITQADPVRGIATSGCGGRSFSFGIADAVTVLAADAAAADAAATLVANAVDLPNHAAIARLPACELDPQSDLGARLVTRSVGFLSHGEIEAALDAGLCEAERLAQAGLLIAAALTLHGETRTLGPLAMTLPSPSMKAIHAV